MQHQGSAASHLGHRYLWAGVSLPFVPQNQRLKCHHHEAVAAPGSASARCPDQRRPLCKKCGREDHEATKWDYLALIGLPRAVSLAGPVVVWILRCSLLRSGHSICKVVLICDSSRSGELQLQFTRTADLLPQFTESPSCCQSARRLPFLPNRGVSSTGKSNYLYFFSFPSSTSALG